MWSCVVVVAYEAPVLLEQVWLNLVGFMERFNLANGCWPANASSDMLNTKLAAAPVKLWCPASGRLKLSSLISKDLLGNAISSNCLFKQQNGVLASWAPNLSWARYEAWMVILVADHPPIVAAELKISLPKTITMFSLETFGSPCLSGLSYRMVQSGFADNMVSLVVVDGEAFVTEVTCYLVWTPTYLSLNLTTLFFRVPSSSGLLGRPRCFSRSPFQPSAWYRFHQK